MYVFIHPALLCNEGCAFLSPEKDFSPQVVPDTVEVLLIEQSFTDGPVKGAVRQVRQHVLPAKTLTGQCDSDDVAEQEPLLLLHY